jgi:uncharacterized protein (DUF983 family)
MNSLPEQKKPALLRMVLRGVFRRCAWCGGKGAFFTSWYKKGDRCTTCNLSWERGYEGFELGAATMGIFMTFGSIIMWMIISVLASVELVPLLMVAGVLAVAIPILGYPVTYTIWAALDLTFRPPVPQDFISEIPSIQPQ